MPIERAIELFAQRFGGAPDSVAIAPGRVNLIGEHTDYNDGFVFPAAIDRSIVVAARVVSSPSRIFSERKGAGPAFHAETAMPSARAGWVDYAAGMAWALRIETATPMPNIEAAIASDLPMGSGVSSSAAMELAFGTVWADLANLEIALPRLAQLGQRCENEYVGVQCGIMDQMASAMGRRGSAMFMDTRSLRIEYSPIPKDLRIVLCDTRKKRALSNSAYNERKEQCAEASKLLGVESLRDATVEALESARGRVPATIWKKARHVVSENARCNQFHRALHAGRIDDLAPLMRASHESLRYDYEVSCFELDAMADAAWGAPGCRGARMTGAGFGGACVALVDAASTGEFCAEVSAKYALSTGLGCELIVCNSADGSRIIGEEIARTHAIPEYL